MNVTAQDDQLAVFANAAAHLEPGGCFVVEVIVPQIRRVQPGETARVFTLEPRSRYSSTPMIVDHDLPPRGSADPQ